MSLGSGQAFCITTLQRSKAWVPLCHTTFIQNCVWVFAVSYVDVNYAKACPEPCDIANTDFSDCH